MCSVWHKSHFSLRIHSTVVLLRHMNPEVHYGKKVSNFLNGSFMLTMLSQTEAVTKISASSKKVLERLSTSTSQLEHLDGGKNQEFLKRQTNKTKYFRVQQLAL